MRYTQDKKLKGIIYCAGNECGIIKSIELPQDYPQIFTVGASELKESNFFDMLGNKIQIFAEDQVTYPGQPLFAVFGPDKEDIEVFCRQIKLELEPLENKIDPDRRVFGWNKGKASKYFDMLGEEEHKDELTVVNSRFAIRRHEEKTTADKKFLFTYESGKITANVETLWPVHFKKTISSSLGIAEKDFIVKTKETFSLLDQMTYKPVMLAMPAVWVAVNKKTNVEIVSDITAYHPALTYYIESVINKTTTEIIATKINVTADMGAFFVLENEMANSLFAGLITLYNNKTTEIEVETVKSNNPPSNLYRGLGYAPSIAAFEHHSQLIANTLQCQPNSWKINNIDFDTEAEYKDVFNIGDTSSLPKTILRCCEVAEFNRKYSAYKQKNISGNISPVINYARGIGIASAGGVSGFSFLFNRLEDFSLSATLDEDSITLNCGMQANEYSQSLWSSIVKKHFPDILTKNIFFTDINDSNAKDLGPAILERSETIVPRLIENVCTKIKNIQKKNPELPITAEAQLVKKSQSELYNMDSFGTVIIDLYIDPVMLKPVIYNVDAEFEFGKISDKEKVMRIIRQTITQTIRDICPDASVDYQLALNITQRKETSSDMGISLARGLTMAAVVNALSQSLCYDIYKLPITSNDVLSIIKMKEENIK